jgi:hypothetical protein
LGVKRAYCAENLERVLTGKNALQPPEPCGKPSKAIVDDTSDICARVAAAINKQAAWRRSCGRVAGPLSRFSHSCGIRDSCEIHLKRERVIDRISKLFDGVRLRRYPVFNAKWYLERNPDVLAAKVNPLHHFLDFGGLEGRDPHPLFSSSWYLPHTQMSRRGG